MLYIHVLQCSSKSSFFLDSTHQIMHENWSVLHIYLDDSISLHVIFAVYIMMMMKEEMKVVMTRKISKSDPSVMSFGPVAICWQEEKFNIELFRLRPTASIMHGCQPAFFSLALTIPTTSTTNPHSKDNSCTNGARCVLTRHVLEAKVV